MNYTQNINLESIWNSFNSDLYKYIVSRVKDEDAAKDILQDTFIKIQKNIHSLKDDKSLKFWIYKITYNSVIDYFRKLSYDRNEINEIYNENLKSGKNENIEKDDKTSELAGCIVPFINKLPDKYKEALMLTEFENYSQKELAGYLGISYSGAKSRVQRGKVMLRELFEDCCNISYDRYGNIIDYKSRRVKGC